MRGVVFSAEIFQNGPPIEMGSYDWQNAYAVLRGWCRHQPLLTLKCFWENEYAPFVHQYGCYWSVNTDLGDSVQL